jgi:DNA helicase HerA-like ATPase
MKTVTPEALRFGTTVGNHDQGKPVFLEPSWLIRGTVIVGVPGVGKSHDISLIAGHLGATGVSVVILDRTGEHAETLSSLKYCQIYAPGNNLHLSLLAADRGWDEDELIEGVLDTLSHYVQVSFPDGHPLTASQQKVAGTSLEMLLQATPKDKTPRISNLLEAVRQYHEPQLYQGVVESRESVVSRLRPLTIGTSKKVFDSEEESLSFETFFEPGIHVIDLSEFKFEHPKDLVSQIIIKRLYRMAKEKGRSEYIRQLLVIDEAHHVAPEKLGYESYLDSMVTENRKYGQGVLVATTSPAQLSKILLKNMSIKICHLLNDGQDIELMYRFMGNQDERDRFMSDFMLLETGQAMVRISTPVQIPLTKISVSAIAAGSPDLFIR